METDTATNEDDLSSMNVAIPIFSDFQYSYNVPSGGESDPEMLRAESLFYNTPLVEKYSDAVYFSLQTIQDQCAWDFQQQCAGRGVAVDLFDTLQQITVFDVNRRLAVDSSEFPQGSGRRMLEQFRSFYHKPKSHAIRKDRQAVTPPVKRVSPIAPGVHPMPLKPAISRASHRGLRGELDTLEDQPVAKAPLPFVDPLPPMRKTMFSEHSQMTFNTDFGSLSNSESESEGEEERARPRHGGRARKNKAPFPNHFPNLMPLPEDNPQFHAPPADFLGVPRVGHDQAPPAVDHFHGHHSHHGPDHGHMHGPDHGPDHGHMHGPDHGPDHGHMHGPGHDHSLSPPTPPFMEDHSFPGALGYGAEGDLCLYDALANQPDSLSSGCVASIAQLHMLRASYYQESAAPPPPPHGVGCALFGFGGLFLLGVVLAVAVKKYYRKFGARKQAIRALLAGLHDRPELKKSVEEELGLSVPAPPTCPCANSSVPTSDSVASSWTTFALRIVRVLCMLLFTFAISLLISISSIEITTSIVDQWENNPVVDPQTGEPMDDSAHPVSPAVVLALLFAICSAEVIMLALLMRGARCLYRRFAESRTAGEVSSEGGPGSRRGCRRTTCPHRRGGIPSAPLVHPVAESEFPALTVPPQTFPSASATTASSLTARDTWGRFTAWMPTFLTNRSSAADAGGAFYVPLLGEEESREMVSLPSSSSRVQFIATGVPISISTLPQQAQTVNFV
eukprot:gene7722-8533_t